MVAEQLSDQAQWQQGWRPKETLPTSLEYDQWIEVQQVTTYMWRPYKENSQQYRQGLRGRWQVSNGFGGWENSEPPNGPWRFSKDNPEKKA